MSIRKLALVVATLSASAVLPGEALAADPVQDYLHDWSGFFIGAHVGYGAADVSGKYTGEPGEDFMLDEGGTFDLDLNGFVAGGQAGYNWQSGNLVLGLEADVTHVDWSDELINGTPELVSANTDWVGTLRGRAGYAMDNLLVFATAGLALTDTKYYVNDHVDNTDPSEFGTLKLNDLGFVVGGGAEYAVNQSWSIKAEALYFIFDDRKDAPTLTHDSEDDDFAKLNDAWMIRAGVNFHF